MLGQELVQVFSRDEGYVVTAWDRDDIDVTDFAALEECLGVLRPDIVVNAVAYNAVDQCEADEAEFEKAMLLNAEVPKVLARLAKGIGATLVHYSTDYVFDGTNEAGYAEDAEPNPISRYGVSKRAGEKNILATMGKNYVVRLSKLFGKPALSLAGKKSFFEKMLEVAAGKTEVTVVDDEKSCFTYAPDLALATKILIQDGAPYGIYHLANAGAATWYEAAQELFRLAGLNVAVKPVGADMFPRPAKRPKYSALLNTKWIAFRPYTEALEEYIMGRKES